MVSISFNLLSHDKEAFTGCGQKLVDHLRGVYDIAEKTSKSHGIDNEEILEVIRIISYTHDFGKASTYFQNYLVNKVKSQYTRHGEISAYLAFYLLPEKWKLIGFMCVKKHHGNLEPENTFFSTENKDVLYNIALSVKENLSELKMIYSWDIEGFFKALESEKLLNEVKKRYYQPFSFEEYIWYLYLWSLLLTGDKTQLIRKGKSYLPEVKLKSKYVENYKSKIRRKLINKYPEIVNSEIFEIRETIFKEISESIDRIDLVKDKRLSITVPTGTGKTLSVYNASIKLLNRIRNENVNGRKDNIILPQIIYCLPFTSVIDQNYDVFCDVLKKNYSILYEDIIIKHHSLSPIKYKSTEEIEYKNYDAIFNIENWQSNIVVTTFIQLLNSVFKPGINGINHRFHRLAGSVIVLDEVQAIPPQYYKMIEKVFDYLCEYFNCYIILVTATKPVLFDTKPLVREHNFKLDRIQLENYIENTVTLEELCNIVKIDIEANSEKSFLVILNTIKSSQFVYKELKEWNIKASIKEPTEIIYLSTSIIPKERKEIIDIISKNRNKKYIVISTQLIEAGVDIDFDIVYRDFAPLDCIVQTCGRANRNGLEEKGIVKLFKIKDNETDKYFANYIYNESLLFITDDIIKEHKTINERVFSDLVENYFKQIREEIATENIEAKYEDFIENIKKYRFKEIRNSFNLISKDTEKIDVIILLDDTAMDSYKIISNKNNDIQEIQNAWRTLNQYRISVDKKKYDKLPTSFRGENESGVCFLDKKYYEKRVGPKDIGCLYF